MSNKIKSLLIILAVFSFISLGATTAENSVVSDQYCDCPILPAGDGMPILPPGDSHMDIQLADNPILPAGDGMPILPPGDSHIDIQLADCPILPPGDGIIFPNPVPPTTSAVTSIS